MERKYKKYLNIEVFEPKGYHFDKNRNRWIFKYMDGDKLRRKSFKNEKDGINFLDKINKKL